MKQRIKHRTSRLVLLGIGFIAALGMSGCSKTTDDIGGDLPDGKYPMTFTAAVEGQTVAKAATRATIDNTWGGTEEVAVQVGSEVKKYTAANDGALTVSTPDNPHYWTNSTMTVQAWHSSTYSATRPTTFTVVEDQNANGGTGFQQSDMLYISQNITFNASTPPELTFKHLPAKVIVNLKADTQNGVTENEVKNASVSIVNQSLTSGTIAENGTVTQTTGTGAIVPKVNATAESGYQQAVQALLVPQQMQNTKFIKVTIGQSIYYYTPKNDDADLEAGKQYTYNITVKKDGLTVTLSTNTEWTSGVDTPITSKEVATGYTASDLKPGDYYYSDGTWSDGGYRKYNNDSETALLDIKPVLTNPTTGATRTVIGIVYWVGDPTAITPANAAADIGDKTKLVGDATLKNVHPDCTHGLVVALGGDDATAWQSNTTSVQEWLNKDSNNNNNNNYTINSKSGAFLSVVSGTGRGDPLNNIQGYNNTKAIEAFNAANSGYIVQAVAKVVAYRDIVPAPASSSDWYLPSEKELTLLCGTDVANIWNNNSGDTSNRDLINGKLSSINGATQLNSSSYYWSSTEDSNSNDRAWSVDFNRGYVPSYNKDYTLNRVRFTLAF